MINVASQIPANVKVSFRDTQHTAVKFKIKNALFGFTKNIFYQSKWLQ